MTHTDIKTEGWISKLPQDWQPYAILMRLDRPIGWWLLLLPGWWGILLGANGLTGMYGWDVWLMMIFFAGAVLMRGAGCIVNDLWDRELDQKVERTKLRPLASGQITIVNAVIFLFFLLFTAFIILVQTSGITILLGILSLLLIGTYPLMKRITWWPQAFLGITFNMSALMGWGAATHHLGWEAFFLYVGGFFWTLGYDTIYAHQDKNDDMLIGIKSTALLFGERSKFYVGWFYILALAFITLALVIAGAGIVSFALLAIPAIHFSWQMGSWDIDDPQSSLDIFKSNRNFGLLVLLSLAFIELLPLSGLMESVSPFLDGVIPHTDSVDAVPQ